MEKCVDTEEAAGSDVSIAKYECGCSDLVGVFMRYYMCACRRIEVKLALLQVQDKAPYLKLPRVFVVFASQAVFKFWSAFCGRELLRLRLSAVRVSL